MRPGAGTGPSAIPDQPGLIPVEFELADGEATVWLRAGEFILDAARRQGLDLPGVCLQGWCTRCAVLVVAGEIDQAASLRYFEADRAAGFALICTGKTRTPARLIALQHRAMREHRRRQGLPVPRG